MHFALTEEQSAIQDMALDFAREQVAPHAERWDEDGHFPVDELRATAPLGMAAVYVDADHGGSGLSRLDGA
ncbi:MAG: acyl-CoA dehydrogenase family protein, partial [Pseudomonadota bacterium]